MVNAKAVRAIGSLRIVIALGSNASGQLDLGCVALHLPSHASTPLLSRADQGDMAEHENIGRRANRGHPLQSEEVGTVVHVEITTTRTEVLAVFRQ